MRPVIWKWQFFLGPGLGSEHRLEMPLGAKVLTVAVQNGLPTLWARVPDADAPRELRRFVFVGTGNEGELRASDEYLGTVQLAEGRLVLHIFERAA